MAIFQLSPLAPLGIGESSETFLSLSPHICIRISERVSEPLRSHYHRCGCIIDHHSRHNRCSYPPHHNRHDCHYRNDCHTHHNRRPQNDNDNDNDNNVWRAFFCGFRCSSNCLFNGSSAAAIAET